MPVLLFKLRGVPDDEAEDVRALLHDNHIDFYETNSGNWGISMPAIWLRDDFYQDRAKALIATYQEERYIRVRAEYEQLKKEGKQRKINDLFKENPTQFIVYGVIILGILYLSIKPFVRWWFA
jgi:hypothetical protein